MLPFRLESQILGLAQAEGLLAEIPVEVRGPGLLLNPDSVAQSSFWGPRIDSLIRTGHLTQPVVETLAWRLSSMAGATEASSWMDTETPTSLPDLEGRTIAARYEQLTFLGEGALGKVYRAFDSHLHRWVALKFLKVAVPGRNEALLREARAQAKIEHPNVCRVYEVGEAEGHGYISMQLVEGTTLSQHMGALSNQDKVRVVRDLALGVHAAHHRGLLHLDIKPGNILVQTLADGSVHPLLSDFGMVSSDDRPYGDRCPMGTPPFSSPEQVTGQGKDLSPRSDVYALGVTLYVLLAKAFPFKEDSFLAMLEAIQHGEPLPLQVHGVQVSSQLQGIISRCLAKNPAARFGTAKELAEALDAALEEGRNESSKVRLAVLGIPTVLLAAVLLWQFRPRTASMGAPPPPDSGTQSVEQLLAQINEKEARYREEMAALTERLKHARTESERREIEREAERLKVLRETELANLRKSAGLLQPPKAALPSLAMPKDEPRSANPLGEAMAARTPARGATTTETPFVPSRKEPLVEPPANPTPQSAPEPKTSAAPAPAATASQPVLPPVVHQSHVPKLTAEEIQRHQDARIRFAVMVDEVGSPRTIRPLSCPSELVPAFTKAIQRTTFTPGQSGGQPARRWVNLTYHVRPTGLEVE